VSKGVVMTGRYTGGKLVEVTHGPSGTIITTDAPKDNGGEGTAFSPTDLCGAALGTCVVTTMVLFAERNGIALTGAHFHVEKIMGSEPRRIAQLTLRVHLPESLSEIDRQKLERAGIACPVHKSLHPETRANFEFVYDVQG
jgi:putative redox protein